MISRTASLSSPRRWFRRTAALPASMAIWAIRAYQVTLAPVLPLVLGPGFGCRYHPTCSHYAMEAVKAHGALTGIWLGLRRLLRCQPLHPGGFDPVPPRSAPSCRAVPSSSSRHVVSLFDLNG